MKKFKRIVALLLVLCIIAPMMPSLPVRAAEVIQRYELDTDGIDAGATYLIVNTASAGSANALRFYYQSNYSRSFQKQSVTVQTDGTTRYIETGFTNEENCTFSFSATGTGKITHGNYSIDLDNSRYANGASAGDTMTFTHQGDGKYQIKYSSGWRTYYLRYNNSWSGSTTSASVYLFKLTEYVVGYDVNYDGNGYTSGTMPQNAIELSAGEPYTLEAPVDLRKDIGEDTWLFLCWNTKADGSGIEYAPGDTITVTEDITLYADWYLQTKYVVSMITYLDGVATDVEVISGVTKDFYIKLEGADTYLPLTRTAAGVYTTKVTENGTYIVYSKVGDGDYEEVHGHKVVIFNQDGSTECMHYSVRYDANGGIWAEGQTPAAASYHQGEMVVAYDKIPTMEGNRFCGWQDQHGNLYQPGEHITHAISEPIVLTAVWEKTITVTVNVVIDHKAGGGADNNADKHEATFSLMRQENGVALPVDGRALVEGYVYDAVNKTTSYTVVFTDMPQGEYLAVATKTSYSISYSQSGDTDEDQTVDILMEYAPENHDLYFDVVVNAENDGEKALMPQAVNVRVSYWGYNENGQLGWHIITQQGAGTPPSTVAIDENGKGTGVFSVWHYWSGTQQPYYYRVEVTSVVMPDGTMVSVSGNHVTFRPDGSGLYTATVSIENGGLVPNYPAGVTTDLSGVYYTDAEGHPNDGEIVVNVEINPMTVTFDAGDGTLEGQQILVLENQFRHPSLEDFVAVPNAEGQVFLGWTDAQGNLVTNLAGQLLTESVTYTALYNEDVKISGSVYIDAVYEDNGQTVYIHEVDRAKQAMVVLQKKVANTYNDIDSFVVDLTYAEDGTYGEGEYTFANVPNDGSEYRVQILVANYNSVYDNDQDRNFAVEEAVAKIDLMTIETQVDIHLDFVPESYQQGVILNAAQIHPDMRPTGALVQYAYRDLGDILNYNIISQHTIAPYGLPLSITAETATAIGFDDVWNRHTNGSPYEYQAAVSLVYGNVPGVYTQEGTAYSADLPYTIEYGTPNNYLREAQQGGAMLEVTLVPKEYKITLDMNLGTDTSTPIYGLEDYVVDDGSGNPTYVFTHTWSYAETFTPYPYREGYIFTGWTLPENEELRVENGTVYVGSVVAEDLVLKANWTVMTGTDYTIRHLELNTDKVLKQAEVFSDLNFGKYAAAAEKAAAIPGYKYVGATIDGVYYTKEENPSLYISYVGYASNLMTIYYLPDGSDGYTDQVEANLEISKTAVLEDNGTYTITMDTFTKDSPITTRVQENKPLDIVLVLDQSGSIYSANNTEKLRAAVENFLELVVEHGRVNGVDHRVAIVGYASDYYNSQSMGDEYPVSGGSMGEWLNTGVFDSNGDFHPYPVTGFTYTAYNGKPSGIDGNIYYTQVDGEFVLMTYHPEYYQLMDEEEARVTWLQGEQVYGYTFDEKGNAYFAPLERNSSGLWLYSNNGTTKLLYSGTKFFTYHTDVWTHRHGLEAREIHATGSGATYTPLNGHTGVYTRTETRGNDAQLSIYKDALTAASVTEKGSGGINPGLMNTLDHLGANGQTYPQYGVEMANSIFEANPLAEGEDRSRVMVVFTDGMPGNGAFNEKAANAALEEAYISKNEYGATVYTIGLYDPKNGDVSAEQDYFMNGLSSNYQSADNMSDVYLEGDYFVTSDISVHMNPSANSDMKFYYAKHTDDNYYQLDIKSIYSNKKYTYQWVYTVNGQTYIFYQQESTPWMTFTNGTVGGKNVYEKSLGGYKEADKSGFYAYTKDGNDLENYFREAFTVLTSRITKEIILEDDTILRDIMNQGLVLTEDTQITVYLQPGTYDTATGTIQWGVDENGNPDWRYQLSLVVGQDDYAKADNGIEIHVYNYGAENPDDPNSNVEYHPHTVDVTGYDFANWYISEKNLNGFKMIVTIDRVEATDNVQWGRSTSTNEETSGLWLPVDAQGTRQLLLPFDQPTTIFVERTYVLDYGKKFELSDWYFDDQDGKIANPLHLDCNVENGMNYFVPTEPNIANTVDNKYGNTKYGNVNLDEQEGIVTYTPTSMNWGGYDQFYVFGNTWRNTVLTQSANANGNLWNKVTVIPANNIYYEDSFVTTEGTTQNGVDGFLFSDDWTVVEEPGNNQEHPEHLESDPYGAVHGWTDSLADDVKFTDDSAHATGLGGEVGAQVEFTFTGTGVHVYTHTNANSGIVIAMLYRKTNNGQTLTLERFLNMDNLSVSGDYYSIPTISFENLPYGTYVLKLIATAGATDGKARCEYYLDGVRVLNPLGRESVNLDTVVQKAYEMELNAVFTEIRDILLDYNDFNLDLPDSSDGKMGAVFIDQIKEGQGSGNDSVGNGVPTYEVGTFEAYGPKNEVYLSAGQAIVLKVAEGNNYYVGMKSLTGAPVTAYVSGQDYHDDPVAINVAHTADLYYQVTPIDGYIVIQNGNRDGAILSITNLRTTNLVKPAPNGGVLELTKEEAVLMTRRMSAYMEAKTANGLLGDIDGDGIVNNDDVVTLLWTLLFPEDTAVAGRTDLNGDNQLTNADVVDLLWYVLFPEENSLETNVMAGFTSNNELFADVDQWLEND